MSCDDWTAPTGELTSLLAEVDEFSGIPNHTALLPEDGLAVVSCVLAEAPVGPAAERPNTLGYRGVVVSTDDTASTGLWIELYQGALIIHEGDDVSYRLDEGRALEQYLWCLVYANV